MTQLTASESDLASNDCSRFMTLIPAGELTARVAFNDDDEQSTSSDGCVWELVHCRSETEGRPETVFQLAWYIVLRIELYLELLFVLPHSTILYT